MAAPGAKPNPDRSQVRRYNADKENLEWTEVDDVPFAGAPALPTRAIVYHSADQPEDAGADWPGRTLQWWAAVSTMPHAALWRGADWEFAFDVAELHARFVEGWKGHGGSELRQQEKLLGMLPDHRRDLRIRYVDPAKRKAKPAAIGTDGPGASVTNLDDHRSL